MPSNASLQAWRKTTSPGRSMCSLNYRPIWADQRSNLPSSPFRTSIGSRRRSRPLSSSRSKANRNRVVLAPIAQPVEHRHAVAVAGHRPAVEQERAHLERTGRVEAAGAPPGRDPIHTRLAPRLVTSSNDQAIPTTWLGHPCPPLETGHAPEVLSHLAACGRGRQTLLPARRRRAGDRLDQVVTAHLQEAAIVEAGFADKDRLHRAS
jgi:hypothetical protein